MTLVFPLPGWWVSVGLVAYRTHRVIWRLGQLNSSSVCTTFVDLGLFGLGLALAWKPRP